MRHTRTTPYETRKKGEMVKVLCWLMTLGLVGVMGWGPLWAAISETPSLLPKPSISGLTRALSADQPGPKNLVSPALVKSFGHLPLSFEENQGQVDAQVKYLARGKGYTLFLTETEAVLALRNPASETGEGNREKGIREALGIKREAEGERATAARQSGGTVDDRSSLPSSPPSSPLPSGERERGEASKDHKAAKEEKSNAVIRMKFTGANTTPKVSGQDQLPGIVNYFIGNDPEKWRTKIPTYKKVQYDNLYNGIDLAYYGNQGRLEYDLVVAPGADPSQIQLAFEGPDGVSVSEDGDLVLALNGGDLRLLKPHVYQVVENKKIEVAANYVVNAKTLNASLFPLPGEERARARGEVFNRIDDKKQAVAIHLAAYDKTQPLIIDPVLAFSTYLDASVFDTGRDIEVDVAGNAYVTGIAFSPDFPTTAGAFDTSCGVDGLCDTIPIFLGIAGDGYVAKINSSGTALVYATYFGGSTVEEVLEIALDNAGNVFLGGRTESADFPVTPTAFDPVCGTDGLCNAVSGVPTPDAFLMKLNAMGSALVYSTFLGGSDSESGIVGIVVDAGGSAYVAGSTQSGDFPTTAGAFDTTCGTDALCNGGTDGFVTKFNPSGSNAIYSTFLGGSLGDSAIGIKIDPLGQTYLTGSTWSNDFPTTVGAFDTICGTSGSCSTFSDADAFVTKLSADGSTLVYSTFLGGSGQDNGAQISIDSLGNGYIVGRTFSNDFPVSGGAVDATCGTDGLCNGTTDAFVTKLNPAGSNLVYSTFLGGSNAETGRLNLAVDNSGHAILTGETSSADFPTTIDGFDLTCGSDGTCNGSRDGFVTKLSTDGSHLIYSTYLGGTTADDASGIALSGTGAVYVIGKTNSVDFPVTLGAFDTNCGNDGLCNAGLGTSAFVVKIVKSGSGVAWGDNDNGQVGDGSFFDRGLPVNVQETPGPMQLTELIAIAGGARFSLGLKGDGTVWAWGDNNLGQLGDGCTPGSNCNERTRAGQVLNLTDIVAIDAGGRHGLALKFDGTVWAWGDNSDGQVGTTPGLPITTPQPITGLTNIIAISAGASSLHSLALAADGTVWAWGGNNDGELGNGVVGGNSGTPAQVVGIGGAGLLSNIIAVGAGGDHNLALSSTGAILAWGRNFEGQLGDGSPLASPPQPTPIVVPGFTEVAVIEPGSRHSVALMLDGTVWAWGGTGNGQVGNGVFAPDQNVPVQVSDPLDPSGFVTGAVAIVSGSSHSLALKSTGAVLAWGTGSDGELGDGLFTINRNLAGAVTGLTDVFAIGAGLRHSLALTTTPPPNTPPTANNQTVPALLEDSSTPRGITLTGSDAQTSPGNLLFVVTSLPGKGILSGTAPNLTYQPNPNVNGPDSFTFAVTDDGVPALTSADATVTLSITPVNDAPEFTGGGNVMVNENAGLTTVASWATGIRAGPVTATDESSQTLTFTITGNTNPALFSLQPSVNSLTGALMFQSAPNAAGTADLTLVLSDNGGTANGGVNASSPQFFTITVVDDVPAAPHDLVFDLNGGALDLNSWTPTPGTVLTVRGIVRRNGVALPAADQPTLTFSVPEVTQEPGAYTNDPNQTPTVDFTFSVSDLNNGDRTLAVTSQDYGGRMRLHIVTSVFDDGTGTLITREADLTLPRDADLDGLADAWEELHGGIGLYDGLAGDPGSIGGPALDGLSAKQKYRGFKWGQNLKQVKLGADPEVGVFPALYQTNAWVIATGATANPPHFRGTPTRRDLFLEITNYDVGTDLPLLHDASCNCPFALGDAFFNAGVDVHVRSTDVVPPPNTVSDRFLDFVKVVNREDVNGKANRLGEDGATQFFQVNGNNARIWHFDRKGESCLGTTQVYQRDLPAESGGGPCSERYTETYQIPLDHYFADRGYVNGNTFTAATVLDSLETGAGPNAFLDPVTRVRRPTSPPLQTNNTDQQLVAASNTTAACNAARNGAFGDIRITDGTLRNCIALDLSAVDINNNGGVELGTGLQEEPEGPTLPGFENSLGQVLKRTITHELGHAVGIPHGGESNQDLMRSTSHQWQNDGQFDPTSATKIKVHNQDGPPGP